MKNIPEKLKRTREPNRKRRKKKKRINSIENK